MTTSCRSLVLCAILHLLASFCDSIKIDDLEKKLAVIDASMKLSRDTLKIPGMSVGIIVDGQIVSTKGYGVLDLVNETPVTTRSRFAVASCTKAFTAFLLGLLVDEGRLNWDDPVINHIPEFRLSDDYRTHHVTVRDLITHRTGQPRHDFLIYANIPRNELLERIPHLRANYQLREKYQYTNIMFAVAGIVAERITGQSWEDLIKSRIFAPLGLTRSNCSIKDPKELDEVALPYTENADGQVVPAPWIDVTILAPSGSIVSTIEDMTKWVQVHLRATGQNLIQSETLDEIHTIQMAQQNTPKAGSLVFGYALGWSTAFYRGRYQLLHSGRLSGIGARVSFLPEEKIGVVILLNSDSHSSVFLPQALNRIFDILLDISAPSPQEWVTSIEKQEKQRSRSIRPENDTSEYIDHPDQFVGKFFNPGYGRIEIGLNDSQLCAIYGIRFSLKPKVGRDFFGVKSVPDDLEQYECSFLRDRWGDVSACQFNFETTLPPIVFEKEISEKFYDPKYLEKFIGSYESSAVSVAIRMDKKNRLISSSGELKPVKLNIFHLRKSPTSYYEFIVSDNGSVLKLNVHDLDVFELLKK